MAYAGSLQQRVPAACCSSSTPRPPLLPRRSTSSSRPALEPTASVAAVSGIARAYDYNSEEGLRQKATIEHVWGVQGGPVLPEEGAEAWALGWQVNERNFMESSLQGRLIKRVASEHLGISEEELNWRLAQLLMVLPGLEARLAVAPPKLVARLAAHTSDVADRMLLLKSLFPEANISAMVERRLSLLLDDDMEAVRDAERKLRAFLPDMNVDRFVEAFPLVLDYDSFEMAAQDALRILPGKSLPELLRVNPELITSLVKGKNLIPYDEISNPWS